MTINSLVHNFRFASRKKTTEFYWVNEEKPVLNSVAPYMVCFRSIERQREKSQYMFAITCERNITNQSWNHLWIFAPIVYFSYPKRQSDKQSMSTLNSSNREAESKWVKTEKGTKKRLRASTRMHSSRNITPQSMIFLNLLAHYSFVIAFISMQPALSSQLNRSLTNHIQTK